MSALTTFSRNTTQTRTISITSGKGGVGKTSIVSNLATALARTGQNVLILDGDLGMANVDIMFGTRSRHSIKEVFTGQKKIEEVLLQVDQRVWLIPGGSGFNELQSLSDREKRILLDQMS